MSVGPNFYSLLYLSALPSFAESPNSRGRARGIDDRSRLHSYLRMGARLSRTIHQNFGHGLTLATNQPSRLTEIIRNEFSSNSAYLKVIEIPFEQAFPTSGRFHSASQKVALHRFLGGEDGYSIVLDLDMICLRDFIPEVSSLLTGSVPVVYDISDQVLPAYGPKVVLGDLALLLGLKEVDPGLRWYGGEFIGGDRFFFRILSEAVAEILPRYLQHHSELHHQGDEIITSAALNNLMRFKLGQQICDLAPYDAVRRFWGTRTLHSERPLPKIFGNTSFLHLPAKKRLLESNLSERNLMRVLRNDMLSRVLGRVL